MSSRVLTSDAGRATGPGVARTGSTGCIPFCAACLTQSGWGACPGGQAALTSSPGHCANSKDSLGGAGEAFGVPPPNEGGDHRSLGIRKPHTWVSALTAPCWDLGWLSGRAPALPLKVEARSPIHAAHCAGPEFTSSAPPPTRHVFSGLTFTFSKGQPGEHKPSLAGPCMSLNEFRAHEVRTQFPARSRQSPGGCTIIDRPSRLGLLWGLPHPAGLQTPAPCPGRVNDQPEPLPPAAERVLLAGDRGPLETTLP